VLSEWAGSEEEGEEGESTPRREESELAAGGRGKRGARGWISEGQTVDRGCGGRVQRCRPRGRIVLCGSEGQSQEEAAADVVQPLRQNYSSSAGPCLLRSLSIPLLAGKGLCPLGRLG
jgi:hypothetical protein